MVCRHFDSYHTTTNGTWKEADRANMNTILYAYSMSSRRSLIEQCKSHCWETEPRQSSGQIKSSRILVNTMKFKHMIQVRSGNKYRTQRLMQGIFVKYWWESVTQPTGRSSDDDAHGSKNGQSFLGHQFVVNADIRPSWCMIRTIFLLSLIFAGHTCDNTETTRLRTSSLQLPHFP